MTVLDKHVALVGFMGAGKTTLGTRVAATIGREFVDIDDVVEATAHRTIPELFAEGESVFRALEESVAAGVLASPEPKLVALGGGAVKSDAVRARLAERATTVWLDAGVDVCWERVRASDRPLAQDEATFRRLYDERRPLYEQVAEARADDADDVVLAAAGVRVERGAL